MALWREVAGYEGLYAVSDEGEVVSLPRAVSYTHLDVYKRQVHQCPGAKRQVSGPDDKGKHAGEFAA